MPFVSWGKSASVVSKKTRLPSAERLRERRAAGSSFGKISGRAMLPRAAGPLGGAPLGAQETQVGPGSPTR